MSRFYVPKESIKDGYISVSGKEAHHILDVMRLGKSDEVVAFDGTGKEYIGIIKETRIRSLVIKIVETKPAHNVEKHRVTLVQAIPKKEKMCYIVEKATELGAASIIPVITERTIVDWDEKKRSAAAQRWQRIAIEASKQCGRHDVPEVEAVTDYSAFISKPGKYDLALIAALSDKAVSLKNAISGFGGGDIIIAIGPEGDFTVREIKSALDQNFKLVSLGTRVLKSDTAGLAVLAILNHEFSGS